MLGIDLNAAAIFIGGRLDFSCRVQRKSIKTLAIGRDDKWRSLQPQEEEGQGKGWSERGRKGGRVRQSRIGCESFDQLNSAD